MFKQKNYSDRLLQAHRGLGGEFIYVVPTKGKSSYVVCKYLLGVTDFHSADPSSIRNTKFHF